MPARRNIGLATGGGLRRSRPRVRPPPAAVTPTTLKRDRSLSPVGSPSRGDYVMPDTIDDNANHDDDLDASEDDSAGSRNTDDLFRRFGLHEDVAAFQSLDADADPQSIEQAVQYDNAFTNADPDSIPSQAFEGDGISIPDPITNTADSDTFAGDLDDSEEVPHARTSIVMDNIMLAFGLYCQQTSISRTEYSALREILAMPGIESLGARLPSCASAFKRQTTAQLPLLKIRKKTIPVVPEKFGKDKAVEDLYFFDPVDMFKAFLASDMTDKIHFGFGEFHDVHRQDELWKTHAWRSSIRSTSGQFVRYHDGLPIFPSDFVTFRCNVDDCDRRCSESVGRPASALAFNSVDSDGSGVHVGRVFGVGEECRSGEVHGRIVLQIQEVLLQKDLSNLPSTLSPPVAPNEAMLSWNIMHYVEAHQIVGHVAGVCLDYDFQDPKLGARRPQSSPPEELLCIRRIYDGATQPATITPLCLCNPLRGELEIQTYGRTYLEAEFCRPERRVLSFPFLAFIDGFGLYRNVYRTLMGMYLIPSGLSFQERQRRANVLPVTLGPHGSNFADVVDALGGLTLLDRGIEVEIHGEKVFLCAFTQAFLGDMPQQQKNSGMKTQKANLGCRNCFVSVGDRGSLDFDTFTEGRYHFQTLAMRAEMDSLPTKAKREAYGTEHGLDPSNDSMALIKISPALDIIMTRPGDPAHSEYNGMTRIMHNLLLDAILTGPATKLYASVLRKFPFPPTWPRVQGPLHHLKSYSLSEHARWSVVIPVLLRCWLEKSHIRPSLLAVLRREGHEPVEFIIECFAAAATSNCVLMGEALSESDYDDMRDIIGKHRARLQTLLKAAADSATEDPRRRRSRSRSVMSTQANSPAAGSTPQPLHSGNTVNNVPLFALPQGPAFSEELAAVAAAHLRAMKLPNVHAALHYPLSATEFGCPVNFNVLIGEDKHRAFKKWILATNHRNPERDLLSRENFQQTIRLILLGAYRFSHPLLSTTVQAIALACPQLFRSLMTRSEHVDLVEDQEVEDDQEVVTDRAHRHPKAIGRMQAKHCQDVLGLPTRSTNSSPEFGVALTEAYGRDYNMPNIQMFHNSTIQWCKKFAFYDPVVERRLTYKMGDFFYDMDRRMIRIEHIFVHNYGNARRLFVKGTLIDAVDNFEDPVLGNGYLRFKTTPNEKPHLVGLPSILSRQLYVIPVNTELEGDRLQLGEGPQATEFIQVERTLHWL